MSRKILGILLPTCIAITIVIGLAMGYLHLSSKKKQHVLQVTLYVAITDGNAIEVKHAIDGGANPNGDGKGVLPLKAAVERGNIEIIQQLLNSGASPEEIDRSDIVSERPIDVAACIADISIFKLLHSSVSSHWTKSDDASLLGIAANVGNMQVMRFLVEKKGVSPSEYYDKYGLHATPLHQVGTIQAAEYLVKHGADPNARMIPNGETPLHIACKSGRTVLAKHLVLLGASTDALTEDGKTPYDVLKKEVMTQPEVKFLHPKKRGSSNAAIGETQ
jgi:ankyrin